MFVAETVDVLPIRVRLERVIPRRHGAFVHLEAVGGILHLRVEKRSIFFLAGSNSFVLVQGE